MSNFQLTLNEAALRRMLDSPRGEVGQFIHKIGVATVIAAKAHAPVDSGKLRASIDISLWPGPKNSLEITANTHYAWLVHEGQKARSITGNPILRFPSKRQGGKIIYATGTVQQKARKSNPYLVKALKTVVLGME